MTVHNWVLLVERLPKFMSSTQASVVQTRLRKLLTADKKLGEMLTVKLSSAEREVFQAQAVHLLPILGRSNFEELAATTVKADAAVSDDDIASCWG